MKTEEFAAHVRTGFVSRDEAWFALETTIMKTLEYPMEALSLTKKDWDFVMTPVLQAVLPRSGIAQSFPRDVLYAPKEQFGMGLMHPYYRQNFKKINLLIKEYLQSSITSDLLKSNIEQLRLELGLPGTNWNLDIGDGWRTDGWLNSLLQFCSAEGIEIHDKQPTLQKIATDDEFLMQIFIDAGYNDDTLKKSTIVVCSYRQ